jgi:hypothetical protein
MGMIDATNLIIFALLLALTGAILALVPRLPIPRGFVF